MRPPARTSLTGRLARRLRLPALVACLLAGPLAAAPALAQHAAERPGAQNTADRPGAAYRLGAQDTVRVKVLEWIASKGEYHEWSALGGEYAVGSDGTVSLPLLGVQPAAGLSTAALAAALSKRLRERTGLQSAPHVAVEVAAHRPVYVAGDVARPGEYPFRPGLTVLQAVALAGGRHRPAEAAEAARQIIRQASALDAAAIAIRRARLQLARLRAEAAGEGAFRVPDALADDPRAADAAAEERAIFAARAEALRQQLAALEELEQLFGAEEEVLSAKLDAHDRQIELTREQQRDLASLIERGLAPTNRGRDLERALSELEAARLDLVTARMRARQNRSEAGRDAIVLRNARETEVAQELQAARQRLEQALVDRALAASLVSEAGLRAGGDDAPLRYVVVRPAAGAGGAPGHLPAGEGTRLRPGDVVKATLDAAPAARVPNGPIGPRATRAPNDPDGPNAVDVEPS